MPPRTIKGATFSKDTVAFLRLLAEHRVRYLVVGYHPTQQILTADYADGADEEIEDSIFALCICVIREICGQKISKPRSSVTACAAGLIANDSRFHHPTGSYLSRPSLLKNKRAAGRPKDLDDVRFLAVKTSRKRDRS